MLSRVTPLERVSARLIDELPGSSAAAPGARASRGTGPGDPSQACEASAFARAVWGRSWDWLFALRHRLRAEVQLVDDELRFLLHEARQGSDLSRVLVAGESVLRAAASLSLRTRTTRVTTVRQAHVICVPIATRSGARGALLVACAASDEELTDADRARLELLGGWLAGAVEAHLDSPALSDIGVYNGVPMWRLLSSVAETGHDRDLVAAFIEALAIWHDLDVTSYVETKPQLFIRDVSTGGRLASGRPVSLPRESVPRSLEFRRLPRAHMDEPDARTHEDVLVTSVRGAGSRAWLLVLPDCLEVQCDVRVLALYAAMLDFAIAFVSEAAVRRVQADLSECLAAGLHSDTTAKVAVERVCRAVGGAAGRLVIESPSGAVLVDVQAFGDSRSAKDLDGAGRTLSVRRSGRGRGGFTLDLWQPGQRTFTPQDRLLVEAVAALFQTGVAAHPIFHTLANQPR